jgi:hypothetical protein
MGVLYRFGNGRKDIKMVIALIAGSRQHEYRLHLGASSEK